MSGGEDTGLIATLVITALQAKGIWTAAVTPESVEIEDKSGGGGGKCYRVEAKSDEAIPVVALHKFPQQKREAEIFQMYFARMLDAGQVFSDGGLGPKRLAEGDDWFVEVWEGSGEPDFSDLDKFRELGDLIASVHRLPTAWFDVWRERACEFRPALKDVPHGSHVWWFTCKTWEDCEESLPPNEEALEFWIKEDQCFSPISHELSRLVTSHGDCHPGNLIQTDTGLRLADFEYTTVRSALFDVAFVFMWAETAEQKRTFLKQYLKSSGVPADDPAVFDRLYLDAAVYVAATHCGPLWGKVRSGNMDKARKTEGQLRSLRVDPYSVQMVREHSVGRALEAVEAEEAKDWGSLNAMLQNASLSRTVDQCWFVRPKTGSTFLQVNMRSATAAGEYVRFSSEGHYVGQGTYALQAAAEGSSCCYRERARPEGAKGELVADERTGELVADEFQLLVDGDSYTPVKEHTFPWAVPSAKVELRQAEMCLDNYEELCNDAADVDQLFHVAKWNGERYFQWFCAKMSKYVWCNARAETPLEVAPFTWKAGVYQELRWPKMSGELQGDASKFLIVFDGKPHGRHEMTPLPWGFVSWAGASVQEAIEKEVMGGPAQEAREE